MLDLLLEQNELPCGHWPQSKQFVLRTGVGSKEPEAQRARRAGCLSASRSFSPENGERVVTTVSEYVNAEDAGLASRAALGRMLWKPGVMTTSEDVLDSSLLDQFQNAVGCRIAFDNNGVQGSELFISCSESSYRITCILTKSNESPILTDAISVMERQIRKVRAVGPSQSNGES